MIDARVAPWTLVARQPALWVLWIAIVDVAAWLYVSTSLHWINLAFGDKHALWAIFAIHVVALLAWEVAIARGVRWLDVRWAPRLIAVGAGVAATMLVVDTFLDRGRAEPATAAHLGLLAALYYAYRIRRVDVFMLAAAVLSLIVVVVTTVLRWDVLDGAGGFLLIGLLIVALAGAGAHWLRNVAREVRSHGVDSCA